MRLFVSADRFALAILTALALVPLHGCGTEPAPCVDPKKEGNIVTCSGGWSHRAAAAACSGAPPAGEVCFAEDTTQCTKDEDCTAKPYGRCSKQGDELGTWCGCTYGCATDADCGAKKLCICDGSGGYCTFGHCRTDADCGSGFLCATVDTGSSNYPGPSYYCQTSSDECMTDLQCEGSGLCIHDGDHRVCREEDPGADDGAGI